MDNINFNPKAKSSEQKIFYFFVFFSLFAHCFIFFFSFSKAPVKINIEDTIEASLFISNEDLSIEKPKLEKQKENKILDDSKQLPPLVDEKSHAKIASLENKSEPSIASRDNLILKEEKLAKLRKKKALQRILDRQKKIKNIKQVNKPKKISLSKALESRIKDLKETHFQKVSVDGRFVSSSYASVLKKRIEENYIIPEIFDFQKIKKDPSVKMIINARGEILSVELVESSLDDVFDKIILSAVKRSQPFPNPPKDWAGKEIIFPFQIKDNL